MDRIWKLGAEYRDKAASRNPDDQFLHWFRTVEDISIGNTSGIRWLGHSQSLESVPEAAAIILVTNHPAYSMTYHWVELPPDYHKGTFFYWGDAVEGKHETALSARGNAFLNRIWTARSGVRLDIPVLVFQKPRGGWVKFLGLGAISDLKTVQEPQAGGTDTENLQCELSLLDAREVTAEWLTRRAVEGPSVDAELAPPAWNQYVTGEEVRLQLSDSEISEGELPQIPAGANEAMDYVTPGNILDAITRYKAGENAGFGESHTYDLVYEMERYPLVAVMGMALRPVMGRDANPGEIQGGKDTKTFKHYERLGFDVRPKTDREPNLPEKGILLTWNREKWPWEDLQKHIDLIRSESAQSGGVTIGSERWSVGNRKEIPVGTRFFMVKLGQSPKGIIGCGRTASPIFEDDHFDPTRAADGDKARYVNLEWETLVNPFTEGALDVWAAPDAVLSEFHWSAQQSGPDIDAATLQSLERAWLEFLGIQAIDTLAPPETYTLQDATDELFLDESEIVRIETSLKRNKNVVLQGPPGVGKSFIARRLAYLLLGFKDTRRVEMVQFHQSYSYEDFIQGYRPVDSGFARRDGVFYRFCRKADMDPDRDYVFIIDEINRGNLASILGEVMLLIEKDKRGPEHALPLAYSTEEDERDRPETYRFFIPENVHVLGMMNTADRSLAIVDYALRRRFRFFSLWPQFGKNFAAHMKEKALCEQALIDKIVDRMTKLNQEIAEDYHNLGPGFQIGHSYFCPAPDESPNDAWYEHTIRESIEPLLDEYFGIDNPKKVDELMTWLLS